MKLGIVFPTTEIGTDPALVGEFARTAEDLGYDYLTTYDHVLGAVPRGKDWIGYAHTDPFHEPMVLFGYLAGLARRITLVTGILILPQRQTALVAKQAAAIDVLTGGRLILGVGVGWNDVEYQALGQDYRTRGARLEEQVAVLRTLWTQDVVTFHGRWHHIEQAGLNPLPVQRPIPIWMGGESDTVLRRIARMADGWMAGGTLRTPTTRHPQVPGGYPAMIERLRGYVAEAGRDIADIVVERRVAFGNGPAQWTRVFKEWGAAGGTHLTISTMRSDLPTPRAHIDAIREAWEVLHGS